MSEDLRAENERLKASNDRLARHIIGMDETLESQRRELLAIGWDAAVAAMKYQDGTPVEVALNSNPYRKPVDMGGDD